MARYEALDQSSAGKPSEAGWLRYIPFLVLPFSVFFAEIWFHTKQIENDYQLNRIEREVKALEEEIAAFNTELAELEGVRRMAAEAATLGLVEPRASQFHVVRVQTDPEEADPLLPGQPYDLAALRAGEETDGTDFPDAP